MSVSIGTHIKTVRSHEGAKKVLLSLSVASSENFLTTVWRLPWQEVYDKVVEAIRYAKSFTKDDTSQRETIWNLMFSPEAYSDTEPSYSLRLCEAAKSIWELTVENPIIFISLQRWICRRGTYTLTKWRRSRGR